MSQQVRLLRLGSAQRKNKILSAGCILPLTQNEVSLELGTRHRAAIGASENSDCIAVVVSEETGNISTALDGVLVSNYSYQSLKRFLEKTLVREEKVVDNLTSTCIIGRVSITQLTIDVKHSLLFRVTGVFL